VNRHHSLSDPSQMAATERTSEVARLLAMGLLRLRRPTDSPAPQKVSENSRNELAVSAEPSVTVHAG
jgi:hypothetical protein